MAEVAFAGASVDQLLDMQLEINGCFLPPYRDLPDVPPRHDPPGGPMLLAREGPNGQLIVGLGVFHRSDQPDNPYYRAICDTTDVFAEVTTGQDNRKLFQEGSPVSSLIPGRPEAYAAQGDPGLITTLAHEHDLDLVTESLHFAPFEDGAEHLLRTGFSQTEVAAYLYGRLVSAYYDSHQALGVPQSGFADAFKDHAQAYFDEKVIPKLGHWQFDFSSDRLADACADIFGRPIAEPFSQADADFYMEHTTKYMRRPDSDRESLDRMAKLVIANAQFRDLGLGRKIVEEYDAGNSVEIPFGWLHIFTLRPLIESLGLPATSYQQVLKLQAALS